MILKKFTAVLLGIACIACFSSCEKETEEASEAPVSVGENGVGDIIEPEEGSEEYDLGSYRYDTKGVKLYYDENEIPTALMLALDDYFTSFQDDDYEAYVNSLFPDYAERYDEYLRNEYSTEDEDYDLGSSFELQCSNVRGRMSDQIRYNSESDDDAEITGDFKITRIKAESPELNEGETKEDRIDSFFSYLDETFGIDYKSIVEEQSDSLECISFFVIAEGEDNEEYLIISDMTIIFAEKDGKYYTFG